MSFNLLTISVLVLHIAGEEDHQVVALVMTVPDIIHNREQSFRNKQSMLNKVTSLIRSQFNYSIILMKIEKVKPMILIC